MTAEGGAGAPGDDATPALEDATPALEAEEGIDEIALDAGGEEAGRDVVDLLEPADGLPPVITTADDLAAAVARLAAGTGPLAVDAERASGYRYGQRAYLVQLRRAGAGTVLIDPIACPDLSGLAAAMSGVEAVLHAASQDLPCLAELGYQPRELFDTELAGRLLGYPRVALGTMLEEILGLRLAKEHSAADWSVRPVPAEMLKYAALDVEVLTELRDVLAVQLAEQGKTEWARQEFAAIAAAPPPAPRADPWRRTSGIHKVRTRRALAVVRELWRTRDEIARDADLSPRRVLSDQAIVDAARAEAAKPPPAGRPQLERISGFHARYARKYSDRWSAAVLRARQLSDTELPEVAGAAAVHQRAPVREAGGDAEERPHQIFDVALAVRVFEQSRDGAAGDERDEGHGPVRQRVLREKGGAVDLRHLRDAPVGGVPRADDGPDAGAAHHVDGDAGFVQRAQHAEVREAARASA